MRLWIVWLAVLAAGCEAGVEPGSVLFTNYCSACHAPEGQGPMSGIPPLEGSSWVTGPEDRLIRIVLQGVRGPIEVDGQTYELQMPGFGPILPDADIAAVLSFVRKRYGNSSAPVTAAAVSRVRAETRDRESYWTAAELLEIR